MPADEMLLEAIEECSSVGFELAYDDEGAVYNSVVVRSDAGNAIGVKLSIDKLLALGQWSLLNGLCQLDFIEKQGGKLGESARNYALSQTIKTIEALKDSKKRYGNDSK